MGRTRAALTGLVCAFAACATPAAAFTAIDPLTRQPLYSAEESVRAQASPIPREVVAFDGRHAPGTIVVSTTERRLYYVLGDGKAFPRGYCNLVALAEELFGYSGTNSGASAEDEDDGLGRHGVVVVPVWMLDSDIGCLSRERDQVLNR